MALPTYAFTGPAQVGPGAAAHVERVLRDLPVPMHARYGGAHGIDTLCVMVGLRIWPDAVHELVVPRDRPFNRALLDLPGVHVTWVPGDYMDRNTALVGVPTTRLIAFPRTPVEALRSGTWSTVRRARKRGIFDDARDVFALSM